MRRDTMATILIPASRAQVWARVLDVPGWERWNPVVCGPAGLCDPAGGLETGRRLRLRLQLPGRSGRPDWRLRPEILRVLPGREFSWVARRWCPGLLDVEYRLLLEPPESGAHDQVLVTQQVRVSGLLVPLVWWRLRAALAAGLQQSNRGLQASMQIAEPHRC